MPPRGVKSARRKRQYEHIKESEKERGVGSERAEEIAARTVNKERRQAGETKTSRGSKKTSSRRTARRKSTGRTTAARKATSRKAATRKTSSRKTGSRASTRTSTRKR